jgi:hypothetical protein
MGYIILLELSGAHPLLLCACCKSDGRRSRTEQGPTRRRCSKSTPSIRTRPARSSRGSPCTADRARASLPLSHIPLTLYPYSFPRVLIHPNTGAAHKDHTELMSWMGRPWPLFDGLLRKADMRPGHRAAAERANAQAQTNDIDRDADPATSTSTAPASAPASSV